MILRANESDRTRVIFSLQRRLLIMSIFCVGFSLAVEAFGQVFETRGQYVPSFSSNEVNRCGEIFGAVLRQGKQENWNLALVWQDVSPLVSIRSPVNQELDDQNYFLPGMVDLLYFDPNDWTRVFASRIETMTSAYQMATDNRFEMFAEMRNKIEKQKSPGIAKLFSAIEASLPMERMQIGIVKGNHQIGIFQGSLRVYDGSASHYQSQQLKKLGPMNFMPDRADDFHTPTELYYEARGKQAWSIQKIRDQKPEQEIFEIGNYSLPEIRPDQLGSERNHLRAKWLLLKMLHVKIVSKSPDAVFVVHVASEIHSRLYRQEFGFRVVQSDAIEGENGVEQILVTDGKSLGRHLESILEKLGKELSL